MSNQYIRDIKNCRLLTAAEEREYFTRYRNGDKAAREVLIRSQLPYVVNTAKKFAPRNSAEFSDLIQAGNIGLMIAIEKFDLSRGLRLNTYATWWIRREIILAAGGNRVIRVPKIDKKLSDGIKRERKRMMNIELFDIGQFGCEPQITGQYEEIDAADSVRRLRECIARLDENARQAVERVLAGENHAQAAARKGTSKANESQFYRRALRELKVMMGAEAA